MNGLLSKEGNLFLYAVTLTHFYKKTPQIFLYFRFLL